MKRYYEVKEFLEISFELFIIRRPCHYINEVHLKKLRCESILIFSTVVFDAVFRVSNAEIDFQVFYRRILNLFKTEKHLSDNICSTSKNFVIPVLSN